MIMFQFQAVNNEANKKIIYNNLFFIQMKSKVITSSAEVQTNSFNFDANSKNFSWIPAIH